jgi:hypothetical protein
MIPNSDPRPLCPPVEDLGGDFGRRETSALRDARPAGQPSSHGGRNPAPQAVRDRVHSIGAANGRNGSMSRVAAAVGEGSIAVRLVHELFAAERLGAPTA